MKKFLDDLAKELKRLKMNKKEMDEILADHKEMIKQAQEEGLTDEEITNKFGDPKQLAGDLYTDSNEPTMDYNKEMGSEETKGYELVKSFTMVDSLKNVSVKLVSEDVKYYTHNDDSIQVYFKNVKDPSKYDITLDKGTFSLKKESGVKVFSFNLNSDSKVIIVVPKNLKFDKFSFVTVSGDASITQVKSNELKLKSTSGDMNLDVIEIVEGSIGTVSGDFNIQNLRVQKELNLSAVSGDFKINDGKSQGDVIINTVSGDFNIENFSCNYASVKTVSGDLNGKEFYPNKVDLRSVSGDIEIHNFDLLKPIEIGRKRSVSGDITIK